MEACALVLLCWWKMEARAAVLSAETCAVLSMEICTTHCLTNGLHFAFVLPVEANASTLPMEIRASVLPVESMLDGSLRPCLAVEAAPLSC